MSSAILPGRAGNLTEEQEDKLRQLWVALFKVIGVSEGSEPAPSVSTESSAAAKDGDKEKPKKRSLFGRKSKDTPDVTAAAPADTEDKYGQTKQFQDIIQRESAETLRAGVWSMVKHDNPDSLLLRFLRARKWDVEKALVMFISTISWRSSEMKLDDEIMVRGEAGAFEDMASGTGATQTTGQGVVDQLRMGKAFFHGCDKESRPVCFVRVRLHHQGDQPDAAQEWNTVFMIETARMMLQHPVETATIVFDMSHFGISNMDYTPVKFMVKCFEANYPECLGVVLVYKSPWIFQGFWKIIRGWLDPVVANKIHFVNNVNDLSTYIPVDQIPKELDGQEPWEYKYVEPVAGENDIMKDTATRDQLQAERATLCKQYEEATLKWIDGDASAASSRTDVHAKLRENYWKLDPYIRARSMYDRIGVLGPGGKIDYYPKSTPSSTSQ